MKDFPFQCVVDLSLGGVMPEKKTEGAAAYDLYCPKDTVINKGRNKIPLGVRLCFPMDYQVLIEARSGFELNGFEGYWTGDADMCMPYRFDADVLTGKIDSDYHREISVIVKSYENMPFVCKAGTRIAQMTFVKIDHPKFIEGSIEETTREGFGSTGTIG